MGKEQQGTRHLWALRGFLDIFKRGQLQFISLLLVCQAHSLSPKRLKVGNAVQL